MRRPAFQFYPGDWTSNPNLRRCTFAERGIWVDVLCLMHDQSEYGVLRWPLSEIAEAVKCRLQDLRSLARKDVIKGSDTKLEVPFIYVPRSGRKNGPPVVLLPAQQGPIWFSSRMVKDEYIRTIRGDATRFGAANGLLDDDPDGDAIGQHAKPPKDSPKPPIGDGSSSSSSSSSSISPQPPKGASAVGLKEWIRAVKARGEAVVPDGDPVLAYAERVGLPPEFLRLAWREFRERHTDGSAKRYKDWRAVFRKAVRGNWFKLWYLDKDKTYRLTTAGEQARLAAEGDGT